MKKKLKLDFKEWTNPITKKHTYTADRYDIIYWGDDDPCPYVLFYRGIFLVAYADLHYAREYAQSHLECVLKYDTVS